MKQCRYEVQYHHGFVILRFPPDKDFIGYAMPAELQILVKVLNLYEKRECILKIQKDFIYNVEEGRTRAST